MKNIEGEKTKVEEKALVTASVAGVVEWEGHLILGQDQFGKFGLPSGRIKGKEEPMDTAIREFVEETGLDEDLSDRSGLWRGGSLERTIVWFADEDKTRIGVAIHAQYGGEVPSVDGWTVDSDDEEVGFVKPFSVLEVIDLLRDEAQIRRPNFNAPQLKRWLILRFNEETRKEVPDVNLVQQIQGWVLSEMGKRGFDVIKDPLNYHFLTYKPPNCITGQAIVMRVAVEELGPEASALYNRVFWPEEELSDAV